jgi:hypothetical protein
LKKYGYRESVQINATRDDVQIILELNPLSPIIRDRAPMLNGVVKDAESGVPLERVENTCPEIELSIESDAGGAVPCMVPRLKGKNDEFNVLEVWVLVGVCPRLYRLLIAAGPGTRCPYGWH